MYETGEPYFEFEVKPEVLTGLKKVATSYYTAKQDPVTKEIFNKWTGEWESVEEVVDTFMTWLEEFWVDWDRGISFEDLNKLEGASLEEEATRALDYYESH